MRRDLNLPEQKQQQESISAGEGFNLRDTGPQLSRTSLVLLKNKRFSADERNIAKNSSTMRVVVTTQYWTAVSP